MHPIPTNQNRKDEGEPRTENQIMRFISTSSPPATTTTGSLPPPAAAAAAAKPRRRARARVPHGETLTLFPGPRFLRLELGGNPSSSRLKAGLTEIEPDLEEDPHDSWRTNGVDPVSLILS